MMNQQVFYYLIYLSQLLVYSGCISFKNILNIEKCEEGEYFDITTLKCLNCPVNQTSYSNKDPFSCACKPGFVPTWSASTGERKCAKCPEMHVTSSDGLHCVQCAESQTYNEILSNCGSCPPHMIAVDHHLNGSSTGSVQCIHCHENFVADKYENVCVPCLTRHCNCSSLTHVLLQGICVSNISLSSIIDGKRSYTVRYANEDKDSQLFHEYFRLASYGCNFLKNSSSCQLLVNLCVLLLYSFDFTNACGHYWHRVPFGEVDNLPSHLPMLYYDKNLPANKVLRNSSFEARISLKNKDYRSNFNLTVAKYSLRGQLLSYDVAENVFQVCSELISKLKRLSIGDLFYSKCKLSTQDVLHHFPTEFYDLFLQYYVNEELKVFSLPILNLNYELNGRKVNTRGEDEWQLTRRLFLIDNISGKNKKCGEDDSIKCYVRYIESVEFVVQLQKETATDGFIYPPYLKIRYREATVQELEFLSYIEISLIVTYFVDFKRPLEIISTTMGVVCAFATLLALIKTWSASRRCGKLNVDITTAVHLVCLTSGYIANCFYFILFFICCVWMFTFRLQDVIWVFLPTDSQEFVIKQYIISAFILKIIHVIYVISIQITIDLFFIDWEQPKSYHTNYSLNYKVDKKKEKASVSIWRTYFIANEWNELQTYRKVNVPLLLFFLIFFLNVLGYEDIGRRTILHNFPHENIPFSFIARFTLSILLFLMVSFAQELFRVTIHERYIENKRQMFVDLCSMANISVLIFKFPLHGYYIHGKSVYGEADLNMQSLFDNMKREEGDLFPKRGLEPSSECQTFEVRVTPKFRLSYDSILETFEDAPSIRSKTQKTSARRTERCIEAHEQMKTFLSIFLQHGLKGLDYTVREKLFLENALGLEFQEPKEKSLFFRDHRHSFDKVLLHGEEGVFLVFEMMVFTFVDLLATDFVLASFVTYLIHKFIHTLRYEGGKRNMVYKTLVDESLQEEDIPAEVKGIAAATFSFYKVRNPLESSKSQECSEKLIKCAVLFSKSNEFIEIEDGAVKRIEKLDLETATKVIVHHEFSPFRQFIVISTTEKSVHLLDYISLKSLNTWENVRDMLSVDSEDCGRPNLVLCKASGEYFTVTQEDFLVGRSSSVERKCKSEAVIALNNKIKMVVCLAEALGVERARKERFISQKISSLADQLQRNQTEASQATRVKDSPSKSKLATISEGPSMASPTVKRSCEEEPPLKVLFARQRVVHNKWVICVSLLNQSERFLIQNPDLFLHSAEASKSLCFETRLIKLFQRTWKKGLLVSSKGCDITVENINPPVLKPKKKAFLVALRNLPDFCLSETLSCNGIITYKIGAAESISDLPNKAVLQIPFPSVHLSARNLSSACVNVKREQGGEGFPFDILALIAASICHTLVIKSRMTPLGQVIEAISKDPRIIKLHDPCNLYCFNTVECQPLHLAAFICKPVSANQLTLITYTRDDNQGLLLLHNLKVMLPFDAFISYPERLSGGPFCSNSASTAKTFLAKMYLAASKIQNAFSCHHGDSTTQVQKRCRGNREAAASSTSKLENQWREREYLPWRREVNSLWLEMEFLLRQFKIR